MKTTKNDITGDSIQSKMSSQTFRDNWDKIDWSKKSTVKDETLDAYNEERLVSKYDKQNKNVSESE